MEEFTDKNNGKDFRRQSRKPLFLMGSIFYLTIDDSTEIELYHEQDCNSHVTRSFDYEQFEYEIRQLGLFLKVARVPINIR